MSFGVHHIGMTVANLRRSVEFYSTVFGLDPGMIFDITAGEATAAALDLPRHKQKVALVPAGDILLELIEFVPPRRQFDGRQDDVGYAYVCLGVTDIDAVYERLIAKGVKINTPPHLSEGPDPVTGSKFCIVKDPDGKNVELVEMGPGMSMDIIRRRAAERAASLDDPIVLGLSEQTLER